MIEQFKIEAKGEPPTTDAFEALLTKWYFNRNGKDWEKSYRVGKSMTECLLVKVNYTPDQGAYINLHLFEFARQGLVVEVTGRPTRMFKDMVDFADKLKDAASMFKSDLNRIEKFLQG